MRIYAVLWDTPSDKWESGIVHDWCFFRTKKEAVRKARHLAKTLYPPEGDPKSVWDGLEIMVLRKDLAARKDDVLDSFWAARSGVFESESGWEELEEERCYAKPVYTWAKGTKPLAASSLIGLPRHKYATYGMGWWKDRETAYFFGQLDKYDLWWGGQSKMIELVCDRVDDIVGIYHLDELPIKWSGMTLEEMKGQNIGAVNEAYMQLRKLSKEQQT